MPPLERLTLKELHRHFKAGDRFYFEKYEDGQFYFFTNDTQPFPYTVFFFPSPFARLAYEMTIDGICNAIDEARQFGLKMDFS